VSVPGSAIQGYVTSTPPSNARMADLKDLVFAAGVMSNSSARAIKGYWKDTNRVRWHKGALEKIGGWQFIPLTGSNNGIYIGTVRGCWDWASLDGQQWLAFGTECKLYLVNNATLYDITPIRKVSNLQNPFSTTTGSAIVNVTDLDHRADDGDHITILGPIAIGGVTLDGAYDVTVVDPDNYTITASGIATSSVTDGGGGVTINYDIYCGLAENGFLYGYGAGTYSESTYGTPRPVGSGVPAKMRVWSLQNYGEDLVASYTDGEIYLWTRSNGPNLQAQLIPDPCPTAVQRILVNSDSEFLIAIGASDVITGIVDKMNVRWPSQGSLTDWIPTQAIGTQVANTAGGQRLNFGSRMVTGIQTRTGNLLWSDTTMYSMQYIGPPNIFGFNPLGGCKIAGPNALCDVNGVVYLMAFDDIMIYDGTLRVLPCDVWEYVFNDWDRGQADDVYAVHYSTKNEVTFFYTSMSNAERRYVTYNYADSCWYYGAMPRTAFHDVSEFITGFFENPYGFNGGYLYEHEIGYDEIEASGTNAMDYWAESWDIGAQSDVPLLINSVVPDFPIIGGQIQLIKGLQFYVKPREFPNQQGQATPTVFPPKGPFIVTPSTEKIDVRANGTQVSIRIEAARATWTDGAGTHTNAIVYGQFFRMGVWQSKATPYGKRLGSGSVGAPIDTSGP
jgi:hypothetical protein